MAGTILVLLRIWLLFPPTPAFLLPPVLETQMLPAFCSLLYQFLVFPFLLAPVFLSPDSHLSLCFPPYPSPSPMCVHAKLLQSYPTCCDPTDCSPPGSSVHGILRQEYWSELPRPPPGDLPNPGMEPMSLMSPTIVGWFFTTSALWSPPPHHSPCTVLYCLVFPTNLYYVFPCSSDWSSDVCSSDLNLTALLLV